MKRNKTQRRALFSRGRILASRAVLGGQDLGEPVRARENPAIGALRLPARPVFALGTGYFAAVQ